MFSQETLQTLPRYDNYLFIDAALVKYCTRISLLIRIHRAYFKRIRLRWKYQ
jgi:hypothetical protein